MADSVSQEYERDETTKGRLTAEDNHVKFTHLGIQGQKKRNVDASYETREKSSTVTVDLNAVDSCLPSYPVNVVICQRRRYLTHLSYSTS